MHVTSSGLAGGNLRRWRVLNSDRPDGVPAFLRYVARHASGPLGRALCFLLVASATESISLLLIVPIIGLLSPGRSDVNLRLPRLLERVFGAGSFHLGLTACLAGFVLLVVVRAWTVRMKDLQVAEVLLTIVNDLRTRLFKALSRSNWSYLAGLRASDLNHALTADVDRVQTATMQVLLIIQAIILILVYVAVSALLSPMMTAVAIGIGGAILAGLRPIRRRAKRFGEAFLVQRKAQFATIDDFLSGLKMVKAANAESAYVSRLARGLAELKEKNIAFLRISTLAPVVFQCATALAIAVFVFFAFERLHLRRELILVMLLLFLRLGPRIMGLQSEMQDILVNLSSFGAMRRLELACAAEAEVHGQGRDRILLTRSIELSGVTFRHRQGEVPALNGVDAVIPFGKITAVIAPSGGGKSTLADVLMGLHAPDAGVIRVDGVPITNALRRSWRDEVAYVPQDVFLLNDTVEANLRLTAPAATDAELWSALEVASLRGVVENLGHGLRTLVGDRGGRLSGGERQRLALARALLRRPQLLVLDEATSALDWRTQAAIAETVRRLKGRCTVVTIAHRASMIDFADWVIALEDGRVAEMGAFQDLASRPGGRLATLLAAEARRPSTMAPD